jgi:predicted RNA-binding protein with PUA-like domain
MNWWLVKQEPDAYSFAQFLREKKTLWTGVRNFQARNNLRAMQIGDQVFYYHSNEGREIVGLAKVSKTAIADLTATEGDWICVELQAVKHLPKAVTLEQIKITPALKNIALIRQSRLSVMPITLAEAKIILKLATA